MPQAANSHRLVETVVRRQRRQERPFSRRAADADAVGAEQHLQGPDNDGRPCRQVPEGQGQWRLEDASEAPAQSGQGKPQGQGQGSQGGQGQRSKGQRAWARVQTTALCGAPLWAANLLGGPSWSADNNDQQAWDGPAYSVHLPRSPLQPSTLRLAQNMHQIQETQDSRARAKSVRSSSRQGRDREAAPQDPGEATSGAGTRGRGGVATHRCRPSTS